MISNSFIRVQKKYFFDFGKMIEFTALFGTGKFVASSGVAIEGTLRPEAKIFLCPHQ